MLRRTVSRVTEMTYRPLGDSGLMVSAVGIGCNAFSRRVDLDGVRGSVIVRVRRGLAATMQALVRAALRTTGPIG